MLVQCPIAIEPPHPPAHEGVETGCFPGTLRECCTELCEPGMKKLMLAHLEEDVIIGSDDDFPGILQDDPAPRKDHFGEQAGNRLLISGNVPWGEQRVGNHEMRTLRHGLARDCVGKSSDK